MNPRAGTREEELLREALAYAGARSRHYREKLRGLAPSAGLGELPFTTPAELSRDPLSFLCVPQERVARVTTLSTSGTSGPPKRVFFTARDLQRTVEFFARGMRAMAGPGERALILMSGETENSVGRLLQAGLARIGVAARIGRRDWSAVEALAAAADADCIVGIPAQVLYLCRADASLRPRTVLLSADYVPQAVRRAVEEAWRCRVFTHYGLTETGFGCAVQCAARQGHHPREGELLVEIIDPRTGKSLPPGEPGEIVLTTLLSEAMPLLRYRTGDISRLLTGPCGCGLPQPRLGRIEGRRENDIPLPGEGALSIHRLDELLFSMPAVRAFEARLRREGAGRVLALTVEADGPIDREAAAGLPGGLRLELRYAPASPFPFAGKRRIQP